MTSMLQDFEKILLKFMDIFVLLVLLELLSFYPDINSSYWFKEDVQWMIDKVFREKLMV